MRMKIRSKMQYHITMDYHNSCEMTLYNTRWVQVFAECLTQPILFRKVKKKPEGYVKLPEVVGVFPYRKL